MAERPTVRRERAGQRRASHEQPRSYDEDEAPEDQVPEDDAPDEARDVGPAGDAYGEDEVGAPRRERRRSGSGRVSAVDAADAGMRSIVELIGKKPEGVTAVQPTEDGWLVGVEILEDQRVPSSADILAVYEAELDMDGTLMAYRRTKRYPRGRGDSGEES